MAAWEHNQAAVVPVNVLHRGPSTHNEIAGPEGEIMQILMQGVTACPLS